MINDFINFQNQDYLIKTNTFSGKEFTVLGNVDIKKVFNTHKIKDLDEIINYFNINSFVFNINNTYRILFIEDGLINFHFTGFLSNKNILQYDINNNKFKLIISSFVKSINCNNLDNNSFNNICLKFASNTKNKNYFSGLKDNHSDLIKFNSFLKENFISYDKVNNDHVQIYEVVGY